MSNRLRFGMFMAPFHAPGTNPTLALQRDLELVEHLDRLGYDEAWIGEHHSAGSELIASPEIFIASAIERTRHIKLGTGVVSLSYHNPLWVAERIVMLDHLSRGRFMFGAGPGALPTDAQMIGIQQSDTRRLLEESFTVIMHLLTSEEPITFKNDRWDLRDARLHLRPYSQPLFDVCVAAAASPSGPRLAGRHGVGLLAVGATLSAGFDALALHWNVMEEQAKHYGTSVDRAKWRLVGPVHCAPTVEQAYQEVRYGIEQWFRYFQSVAAFPQMVVDGNDPHEMTEFVNKSGIGVVGTPEMVAAQIERLDKQSSGGFGAYLMLAHEWADPDATKRSFELVARSVMPHFQGHYRPTVEATERARAVRADLAGQQQMAVDAMKAKYEAERSVRH